MKGRFVMKSYCLTRVSAILMVTVLLIGSFGIVSQNQSYGAGVVTVENDNATKDTIAFDWSIDAPGAATYKVARNPNNRTLAKGKLRDGKAKGSIKDVNLTSGIECQYRIAAYDASGNRVAYVDRKIKTKGIAAVGKLNAYPGYKSITLQWNNVPGAVKYLVRRWDASTNKTTDFYVTAKKGKTTAYRDKDANKANVNYAYSIWAIGADGTRSAARAKTGAVKCVRQMYQNIKVNGKWKIANGYSGGKFYCKDGSAYSVTRVSRATCDYSRYQDYPNQTATNFVNEMTKLGFVKRNGKKRMVWVSTYTQRLYLFNWTSAGWKLVNQWDVSTGGAGSPTPMSKYNKTINHRHYQRSRSYYWNCFSSHNALHANPSGEVIDGAPHSHGCVRNPKEKAIWIYKGGLSIGTPVLVW